MVFGMQALTETIMLCSDEERTFTLKLTPDHEK